MTEWTAAELQRRREAVEEAAIDQPAPEQGWSVADLDPTPIARAFGLDWEPTVAIVFVFERWGRDGEGHPVVVPREHLGSVRARLDDQLAEWDGERPPTIPESLGDLGHALAGPGTPMSRLAASVAVREIHELGATGHGRQWSEEVLVSDPALLDDDWSWSMPAPRSLAPEIAVHGDEVGVVFHTISELGGRTLIRHEDRYRNAYTARRQRLPLARASGGFVR